MFAAAIDLTGTLVTTTGDNFGATSETGEIDPTGTGDPINSVWWQWTAPADGHVEINTVGSSLDTILAVYTGSAVDNLVMLDANDDYYNTQSRVVFDAVGGTTYHISVDGYADLTGDIILNLAMAPANDDFVNAAAVTGASVSGSSIGATQEVGESSSAGTSGEINTVWWTWEATKNELVEFNTFGSNFDTLLAIYEGSSVTSLRLVTANDDTDGYQSQVVFQTVAGTTYHIAVDGLLSETGSIVLNHPDTPSGTNRPPVINDGQTFSVKENSPGGTIIGTVVASDPDPGQTLSYAIIDGDTVGGFFIDASGQLSVLDGSALDYESNPVFHLLVRVSDNGSPLASSSSTITVNLLNLHEAPQFDDVGPYSVTENSLVGTVVGGVTAHDVDDGQTISFAITEGNESGAFAIDSESGLITVANSAALNFETTPVFMLTVAATDNDSPPLTNTARVVIFVDDGNEAPQILDQTFALNENSAVGTVAAVVVASDPDANQTLRYEIVGGNDDGAFSIGASSGWLSVARSAPLNFEVTPTFLLTIRVTDSANPALSADATVTINLNDLNEVAVFDNTGPFTVQENSGAGVSVGMVTATDQDRGQLLTFSLVGGNVNNAFAINPATGEISVENAAALDFETRPSYSLVVKVSDNGSSALAVATTVTISLIDVNDAPVLDANGVMSLTPINQGDFNNNGTLVSVLLSSAGGNRITDQDAGAKQGIAVIAADTTNGNWQYSTDGGSTWLKLGAVSNKAARLLSSDSLIRFVPNAGYNGTVTNGISFRAWDQTTGIDGDLADTSFNGGTSAFSKIIETANVKVRSALEQITILSQEVSNLVFAGVLSNNDASKLQSKLNNAKKQLEQGNPNPAANQISSFKSLVNDLVSSGALPPSDGQALLEKADAITVSIWN